ncbi:TIGR03619 family F420-dependent LLM class oxidoreductase [Saccharopolyspora indica]|uniref:TIGR03619 family F420-dependent LLM class oxidoreductase n=1 Tax=Saccharopolyspora indica TaxID=1229659 RepID=UPI0022EA356C|nr:TIGR03619 family F420-dependent LLM class oxidoreductase [Saccharopolyspora indica]MDA3644120.1 TIGR03619 family F420-dependent LLM class oxidoreductase [Saccharopolyspora indica]
MRVATMIFLTDESIWPDRLAHELEERGFAGLYLPEHSHIPASEEIRTPAGEPLPREFGRTLDAFVALGQAAVVTERLALGTGITLVAQHDPIDLAKQIATLDFLSSGRFTLGVGFGWLAEEAADHGVEWSTRRELVRDRMALMRALWAGEPTAYEGEFGSVRASHAHPKPVRAAPRTLLGGAAGPKLFSHIAQYADGWLPNDGRDDLTKALPALRKAWEQEGREEEPEVVPYAIQPSAGKLAHYRDLGVEEVVLQLPSAGEAEVLRALDDYAQYLSLT